MILPRCRRTLDGPRYEPLPLRDQASVLDSRFIDFDVAVIIHLDTYRLRVFSVFWKK